MWLRRSLAAVARPALSAIRHRLPVANTLTKLTGHASRPHHHHLSRALAAGVAVASGASTLASCDASLLKRADGLFDGNEYAALAELLRKALASKPDDAQLQWRLARGLKKLADAETAKPAKEALTMEGLACAEKAIMQAPDCGPAHKWYAIMLSGSGAFKSTSDKIKQSFTVKQHFDKAAELSPKDATSRHLVGVWCFEVAKLSWFEQKAAAALFAAPPTASYEEAYGHFAAAEAIEPGFYPQNKLLLAQVCSKLGRKEEAQKWLDACLASPAKTPEDEETLQAAAKLKL